MAQYGVPVVEQLEPELDVAEARNFSVQNGGRIRNVIFYNAQNPSTTNLSLDCNPPDKRSIVDPEIWATISYNIQFTGDNAVPGPGGELLNIGATDGPRQWPFHQTCSNMQMQVNGTSFTTNPQQWFPVACRLGVYQKEFNTWESTTPSAADTFQEYIDPVSNPNQPTSVRNSLSDYNGGTQWSLGRGAFPLQVVTNTGAAAEVNFTSSERILISPFFPNRGGITGIETMFFQATQSNLARVWSHGADPTRSQITGMSVTVTAFNLRIAFITPKSDFVPLPRMILAYEQYVQFPTSPQTIAPGASTQFLSTTINLNAIPEKIFLMVKRNDAEQFNSNNAYLYTDTCARIDSVSLQFGNDPSFLANYSIQDLFHMSCTNGLNLPYPDWAGSRNELGNLIGAGSFLVVDVARDLGLPVGLAPGSAASPRLSAQVNCTNFGSQAKSFQLTMLVKYVGMAIIPYGGTPQYVISPLTEADVVSAAENPDKEVHDLDQTMIGGKWWSKITKALPEVNRLLKSSKAISKGAEYLGAPTAAVEAAKMLGYGVQNARTGASLTGRQFGGARVY